MINRDHTLHYAIEEDINPELSQSTLQSVVDERGCYYFKGLV